MSKEDVGVYMYESSIDNFEYLQRRIDDIKKNEAIDIKQISDLDRYIGMQLKLVTLMRGLVN